MQYTAKGVPYAPGYRFTDQPWTDKTADRQGREYCIVWQARGDLSYKVSLGGRHLATCSTMAECLAFVEAQE
jgi:hypothetical protein